MCTLFMYLLYAYLEERWFFVSACEYVYYVYNFCQAAWKTELMTFWMGYRLPFCFWFMINIGTTSLYLFCIQL